MRIEAREPNFFIDEREDDMLICAKDWQLGSRCIARRPKLASNDEWRDTAETIIAALEDARAKALASRPLPLQEDEA